MFKKGKLLFFCVVILVLSSCELIKQPPVFKQWFDHEIKKIDWSEVDELPMVEPCTIFRSRALKKECFFAIMSDSIYTKLLRKSDFAIYTKLDTVKLIVTITADNQLLFGTKYPTGTSEFEQKKIDSIIHTKLVDFPKVYPAIKKGLPVTSKFEIPIILLPSKRK